MSDIYNGQVLSADVIITEDADAAGAGA